MDWNLEPHWLWLGFGVLLLAGEAVLPGSVLMWFGFAALITGVVHYALDPSWAAQLMLFSVLGVGSTAAFWYWRRQNPEPEGEERVNRAGAEMVGRTLTLVTEISGGSGRAKVGDSSWRVDGPDLPMGAKVRVVAVESGTLRVEAAD